MIPMAETGDDAGWICVAEEVRDAFSVLSPAYTRYPILLNWSNSARPVQFSVKPCIIKLNPPTKQLLERNRGRVRVWSRGRAKVRSRDRGKAGLQLNREHS